MKSTVVFILLLISYSTFAQTHKISIKGFGEVTATKLRESTYSLNLGKLGTFQCQGKLDPLYLEIKTTVDSLREFPGYKLYKKMDLQEVTIFVSKEEVEIGATIDTRKNFGEVLKMFKIPNPTIGVGVKLTKESFELSGELDFEDDPIILDVVPDFSRFTLANFGIGAAWEKGDGALELSVGISLQTRWKPTSWDPDVQSVSEFSYNLLTNTLSASISMTDTWNNPMLLSKLLKPNSVVFKDVAASLDWPLGAPAPSAFGFTVGQAQFFQLDFAVQLAMDPAGKQIALRAYRNELTMNDFSRILRNGFGLNVPDLFPSDIYIKDAEILFSPNGGTVGEYQIDKGFVLRGTTKIFDAMDAQLDFYANWDDGFYLYYNMDAAFKAYFDNVFRNDPKLKYISGELIKTFEVRKVELVAKADMSLNMAGKTHCEFTILGQAVKFDLEGKFSADALKNRMFNEVKRIAGPHAAAVFDAAGKVIGEAGRVAGSAIGAGGSLAQKYVTLGSTKSKHLHLTDGGEKYCRAHCIPNRAKELVNNVLPSSKSALSLFYDKVVDDMVEIEGETDVQTKQLRMAIMQAEWTQLVGKIEKDWDDILADKEYVGYFVDPKWATNGGNQFRDLINKRKKEYDTLREQILQDLMNARLAETYTYSQIQSQSSNTFVHVEKGAPQVSSIAPGWYSAMWVFEPVAGTPFVKIRNRWKGTYLNIEHGKVASSAIEPGWLSAQWQLERVSGTPQVRIKNAWKGTYLNLKSNGSLECAQVLRNEPSAQWRINNLSYSNKAWNSNGLLEWAKGDVLLVSSNRKFKLAHSDKGILTIYKYGIKTNWVATPYFKSGTGVRFDKSGNLTVYNNKGEVWNTRCPNKGGQTLMLQDNGNLVIHAPGAKVLWASGSVDNPIKYGSFGRIKHLGTGKCLNTEHGLLLSDIEPGWYSAMWSFEPIAGTGFVRIKNGWKGEYLHIEGGLEVQCSAIQPGWHSAQWKLERIPRTGQVRIRSRWKPEATLCFTDKMHCMKIPGGTNADLWELDNLEPYRMSVSYDAENGCGTVYKNGIEVAKNCGWSKTWHTVLMVGCSDIFNAATKVLFYEKSSGNIEFYKLAPHGGMELLNSIPGASTNWERITWEQTGAGICDGVIKFEQADGYWETYTCDAKGNINLHAKKQ